MLRARVFAGSANDLELLERWRGGDRRAGNELFERHFESVYRFFAHKAQDDAVDLVQRTFLGCVEARDRFAGRSSFRTFLFAIARHELLAHWRRRGARADSVELSSVRDLAPSPSTAMLHGFEQRVLLEALRSIPLELQIALELHYWEQLSTAEIAEVVEVPEGTVKSRLRRGREILRERILEGDAEKLRSTADNLDAWAASLRTSHLGT